MVAYDDKVECYERSKGILKDTLTTEDEIFWYIHQSNSRIFYSSANKVHCINEKKEIFTYSYQCGISLKKMTGITTDDMGNIFLADFSKIVQISPDGSNGKTLLSYGEPEDCDVIEPRAISFDKDFSHFLVVSDFGRSVLVYEANFEGIQNDSDTKKD